MEAGTVCSTSGEGITSEHLKSLLGLYERALDDLGYCPIAYPDTGSHVGRGVLTVGRFDCLNHAYWMCVRARRFLSERRLEKAHRWLGTVQGLMFMGGVLTIEDIMSHDRVGPQVGATRRA